MKIAVEVAVKKLESYKKDLSSFEKKKKVCLFLQSRGFGGETIGKVLLSVIPAACPL